MNPDVGLVLEGGAMRGLFTAGVLDVLMQNGIFIPTVIGVSAGAAFGCNYKSGQIGRALRYNLRFCRDKRYCSVRSLIKTGDIYGAEFCYYTIPDELDLFDKEAFNSSPMEFWVVATDVLTGQPVYKQLDKVDGDCMEWIRASASMPMVSRPVRVGGHILLDGGMSDSIPLRFMNAKGHEKNVVVLTRPRDYFKGASNTVIPGLLMSRYPAMLDAMNNRHAMYRCQREYVFAQEAAGRAFVICPDRALDVGHTEHDPVKLKAAYDEGRRIMLREFEGLMSFLNKQST